MAFTLPAEKGLGSSIRERALDAAKRHKATWVELGQYLHTIFRDKLYREWDFVSFETYCMKELGIKQTTASKLLKSYFFLEREEPHLADTRAAFASNPPSIPSFEAVNLLRLAKENKKLTPRDYTGLREAVMERMKEPREIRAQLRKLLSARDETDPRAGRLDRRNSLIKKLVSILSSAQREFEAGGFLPNPILRQMADLAEKLEGQIE